MEKIDLSGYNLNELKELQLDVEKEIKDRQHVGLRKAREQILAIAQEAGVSVEALLAAGDKKQKKPLGQKVQARFQNPANQSQVWTGRGRQPRWVVDGLASGKTLDDFRI